MDSSPPTSNLNPVARPPQSGSGPRFPHGPSTGTGPASAARELAGELLGGKFRIIREVGRGGMGAVYEVLHEMTQHRRALKLLKRVEQEEHVVRFLREASAAGRIASPHIIETFDAGRLDSGEPYVLMELLDGLTLFDYMRDKGGLTIPELTELVAQACDGLHAAHDAGIIHRDVKPANLFVIQRDGKPFVKILDFGISKFDAVQTDATELTMEGELLGTPAYMAPEQLKRGEVLDRRVDVYALGVTLYAACAGQRPFQGTVTQMALAIVNGEHTPLWEICPNLPLSFCRKVERAMEKDRDARYASAKEFADALREELVAVDESVAVQLTMPPEEGQKLRAALEEYQYQAAPPLPYNPNVTAQLLPGSPLTPVVASSPAPASGRSKRWAVAIAGGIFLGAVVAAAVQQTVRHGPQAVAAPATAPLPAAPTTPAPTDVKAPASPPTTAAVAKPADPAPTDSARTSNTAPTPKLEPKPVAGKPPAIPPATRPSAVPTLRRQNPYE